MRRVIVVVSWLLGAMLAGTVPASAEPHRPTAFRLGNAAAPFGYATVIADFNADGAPDFAVADEHGRGASAHRYRLELVVSGSAPYAIEFTSPESALVVAVADVDADRDPDLLLSTPIAEERVAVWLNDGRGHFARATHVGATAHGASRDAIRGHAKAGPRSTGALIPKQGPLGLGTLTRAVPLPATVFWSLANELVVAFTNRSAPSQLRAPPRTTQS